MAVTQVIQLENVRAGRHNPVLYYGPEFDMDAGDSPITSANTLLVRRESTGETYVPGGGGNDFHVLTNGFLGNGEGYTIVAVADFLLPHASPGEVYS